MPNKKNIKEVERLNELFNKYDNLYLTDLTGMNSEQETLLRKECREAGVSLLVTKNTLSKIAAKGTAFEALEDHFKGPTALAFGIEDNITPAKLLVDFNKRTKYPKLKAALVEGNVFLEKDIVTLSTIPTGEELHSQVVGVFSSPMRGILTACSGVLRNFLAVVDQYGKKLEESKE